ncbi:MAG: hypothetical protein K2Q06_08490 [Parvularculaceae bacterium]|nr:hypothetical protein [Parvularculaceae bacterium]
MAVWRASAARASERASERGVRVWRAPAPKPDIETALAGAPGAKPVAMRTVVVTCGRRYYGLRTQGFYSGRPYGRPRFTQGFYSGGPDYRGDCQTRVVG